MTILKVVGIAVLGLVCAGLLKEIKPSFAVFTSVITGLIILFSIIPEFQSLINEFKKIAEVANVDGAMILTVIKVIGIGYVAEFTATLCDDYGSPSIAKKVLFAGKIIILTLSLPIASNIITSIGNIVK